jgi:hypothetical protein
MGDSVSQFAKIEPEKSKEKEFYWPYAIFGGCAGCDGPCCKSGLSSSGNRRRAGAPTLAANTAPVRSVAWCGSFGSILSSRRVHYLSLPELYAVAARLAVRKKGPWDR